MDSRSIKKRLNALQEIMGRNKPCQMTITFADGSTTVTDSVGAITILHDRAIGEIADVTAARDDYAGLAGLLAALCHPAPDRNIQDYE